jgi:hypothetical protein
MTEPTTADDSQIVTKANRATRGSRDKYGKQQIPSAMVCMIWEILAEYTTYASERYHLHLGLLYHFLVVFRSG